MCGRKLYEASNRRIRFQAGTVDDYFYDVVLTETAGSYNGKAIPMYGGYPNITIRDGKCSANLATLPNARALSAGAIEELAEALENVPECMDNIESIIANEDFEDEDDEDF